MKDLKKYKKYLVESVKNEKLQIENRYNEIDYLWNELATFEDDYLLKIKNIESSQTEKILERLPKFINHGKKILSNYKSEKICWTTKLKKLQMNIHLVKS